jgi:threonine dehydrogenase-like Zn-dependent dehydrogenase
VRAVVLTGEREVSIETVADAELEAPTDALLRITSSAIHGTDLHFYERRMGAEPGMADAGHQSATQIYAALELECSSAATRSASLKARVRQAAFPHTGFA